VVLAAATRGVHHHGTGVGPHLLLLLLMLLLLLLLLLRRVASPGWLAAAAG
jgi:hypothetical protein